MKSILFAFLVVLVASCSKSSTPTVEPQNKPRYIQIVSVSIDSVEDESPVILVPKN